MAEKEAGVIDHLLDVERLASGLMLDAQAESDKRIAAARSKADGLYKSQYETIIAGFEKDLSEKQAAVTSEHDAAIAGYKQKIEASRKDVPAFNKLLDKLLSEN